MLKATILVLLIVFSIQQQCNGTTGNYISQHSLGQQDQINDTTLKICPTIKLQNISVTYDSASMTLSNATLGCVFFDGSQTAKAGVQTLCVTGGKIQFQLNYNFTIKTSAGQTTEGTAYASGFSDPTNFTKILSFGSGSDLIWMLNGPATNLISMNQSFTVKRQSSTLKAKDLQAMIISLNTATGSLRQQIITQYNKDFKQILNKTLAQEQIFNRQFTYTYHHPSKNELKIQFKNNITHFGLNETDGLILEFNTYIDGQTIDCEYNMTPHDDYKQFGGIQTQHEHVLYQHIFDYLLKNKWLNDDSIRENWNTNSFQFFVGDLYDFIPHTTSIPPRTPLAGVCNVSHTNQTLNIKRNTGTTYKISIPYDCTVSTSTDIQVLSLSLTVDYVIRVSLAYQSIHFNIQTATTQNPQFHPVGQYLVTVPLLAQFKLNQILKSMNNHRVIGDGFPSWPRDHPNVEVRDNITFFYDSSHKPHFEKMY